MPSRNFRPDWDRGDWQPPTGEWWSPGTGSPNWQQFGRRVARRFVGGLVVFLVGLIGFGAFIATAIVGTTSVNRWVIIVATPLAGVLILALIARYVRRTWRPVRELIGAAGALADGDYSVRVESEGSATIRPITRSFNDMVERLQTDDNARRRLLADLGHELRTPLTVVQGEIEAMLDGVHKPDPEHLGVLLEEVAVMERLLEDLRTLTLAESGGLALHPEPSDLPDLISDVLDSQRRSANSAGVTLASHCEDDISEVVIDPVRVREVLANLVVNGIRAMPGGGTLEVTLGRDADMIRIAVTDDGVGIAEEELPHVFDRFRKGSTSSGSGLGLTISRDLVEAHGGSIGIASTPGQGTTVTFTLPVVPVPD